MNATHAPVYDSNPLPCTCGHAACATCRQQARIKRIEKRLADAQKRHDAARAAVAAAVSECENAAIEIALAADALDRARDGAK